MKNENALKAFFQFCVSFLHLKYSMFIGPEKPNVTCDHVTHLCASETVCVTTDITWSDVTSWCALHKVFISKAHMLLQPWLWCRCSFICQHLKSLRVRLRGITRCQKAAAQRNVWACTAKTVVIMQRGKECEWTEVYAFHLFKSFSLYLFCQPLFLTSQTILSTPWD